MPGLRVHGRHRSMANVARFAQIADAAAVVADRRTRAKEGVYPPVRAPPRHARRSRGRAPVQTHGEKRPADDAVGRTGRPAVACTGPVRAWDIDSSVCGGAAARPRHPHRRQSIPISRHDCCPTKTNAART